MYDFYTFPGNYLLFNTKQLRPGARAEVRSGWLNIRHRYQLSFWYYHHAYYDNDKMQNAFNIYYNVYYKAHNNEDEYFARIFTNKGKIQIYYILKTLINV